MNLLRKNKNWIIGLIIITVFDFFIQPQVEKHYLKFDIENFTKLYYFKIIITATAILAVSIIAYSLIKRKSFEIIAGYFLGLVLFCFIFFFVMQSVLTTVILFVNKLDSKSEHKEVYKILYVTDNKFISAYNINRNDDFIDEKKFLNSKQNINLKKLKVGDTLVFDMNVGLFGVDYFIKN